MVIMNKPVLNEKQAIPLLDDLAIELIAVSKVTGGEKVADDLALDAYRIRMAADLFSRNDGDSDSLQERIDMLVLTDYDGNDEPYAPGVSDSDVRRILSMAWHQICLDQGLDEYVVSKIRGFIVDLQAERVGPEFWERSHQTSGSGSWSGPGVTKRWPDDRRKSEVHLHGRELTKQERARLHDQEQEAIHGDSPFVDLDRDE